MGTHISIVKTLNLKLVLCLQDYYYHKLRWYNLVAQGIINCNKRFIDVFVDILGSVNDLRVLHKYALYRKAENHGLFAYDPRFFQHGFPPYLLGDKSYLLITWIMIPFKENNQRTILELLYNKRRKQRNFEMDNAFIILKKTLKEFLTKFDFHVFFLFYAFNVCYIIYYDFKLKRMLKG